MRIFFFSELLLYTCSIDQVRQEENILPAGQIYQYDNGLSRPLLQPSNSLIQDRGKQTQQNNRRHDQIQLEELETATDIIAYPNVNRYFAASLLHFLWMSHAEDNILSKALPVPISLPVRRMEHYTSTAYRYKYLPSIPE